MSNTKEINLSNDVDQEAQCHLMPCRIEHDGPTVRAREYFWPVIRKLHEGDDDEDGREKKRNNGTTKAVDDDSNNQIFMASFRGRPLQGQKVKLPDGYTAHANARTPISNQAASQKRQNLNFTEFTYWNWDEMPNKDDTVNKAFDWIGVAKAIHDPID